MQKDSNYIQGPQTNKPRYRNRHLRKEALGLFIPLPKGLDFVVTQEYLQLSRQNPILHSTQGSQRNGKKKEEEEQQETSAGDESMGHRDAGTGLHRVDKERLHPGFFCRASTFSLLHYFPSLQSPQKGPCRNSPPPPPSSST